jgi:SAM-dependent methyltransferase
MRRYGVTCSPAEFHSVVNLTFHKHESHVYDELHANMWRSLPAQFRLLAKDYLAAGLRAPVRILDIGCGTGLSSDLFLRTELGRHVREVYLLDSCPEMIARAKARSEAWGMTVKVLQGDIRDLPPATYDLIITCSVLHHIPDLPRFLDAVRRIQAPGGVFLHVQDPNGDYLNDPLLLERKQVLSRIRKRTPRWVRNLSPQQFAGRLRRLVTRETRADYIRLIDEDLIRAGVVQHPMTATDLWRVTDLHDHDDVGISMRDLEAWLPDYEVISVRSYGFYGVLESDLPRALQEKEMALIEKKDPNGQYVGAIRRLR